MNWYFPAQDGEVFELQIKDIPLLKAKYKDRLIEILNPAPVLKVPPPPHKYFYNYEVRQQAQLPFNPDFSRVKALSFGPFLTMIACGSSYHAAFASEYFFKLLKCFKKIHITDPAELDHSDISEGETVLLISQSG